MTNRYYRDSCGFKFPARLFPAEPLLAQREGRFTLPILRAWRSALAHSSRV